MQKPLGLLGPRETDFHRPVRTPIAPAWRHPPHRLQASADPKEHKIDSPLPYRRIPTGTVDRKATRNDIPYHPSSLPGPDRGLRPLQGRWTLKVEGNPRTDYLRELNPD